MPGVRHCRVPAHHYDAAPKEEALFSVSADVYTKSDVLSIQQRSINYMEHTLVPCKNLFDVFKTYIAAAYSTLDRPVEVRNDT